MKNYVMKKDEKKKKIMKQEYKIGMGKKLKLNEIVIKLNKSNFDKPQIIKLRKNLKLKLWQNKTNQVLTKKDKTLIAKKLKKKTKKKQKHNKPKLW